MKIARVFTVSLSMGACIGAHNARDTIGTPVHSGIEASPSAVGSTSRAPSFFPTLPESAAPLVQLPLNALQVRLTKDALVVGDNTTLTLPPPATLASTGFGVPYKRGPHDLRIVAIEPILRAPSANTRVAVVFTDATVPYRLLVELLFTLGENGYVQWLLATRAPGETGHQTRGWLTAVPITVGSPAITVSVIPDGYVVVLGGQRIACVAGSDSLTVPRALGELRAAQLVTCLRSLRAEVVETARTTGADVDVAAVVADLGVTYQDLVVAIDATHESGFSRFALKMPR